MNRRVSQRPPWLMKSIQSTSDGPLWTVCWSPCGSMLAAAGTDRIIRIYSVNSSTEGISVSLRAELRDAHTKTIRCVDWHRQNLLAAASFDGTVSIWSTRDGQYKCVAKLEGHENEVKAVRFSPDGRRLATCGRDRTVWIWSIDTDDDNDNPEFECEAVLQEHSQDVKCLQWHPSGELLFSGSYDNSIKLFGCPLDADEWLCLDTISGHASTVWSLSWHNNHLYSASDDKTIVRWADANNSSNKFNTSMKPERRLEGMHDEVIYSVVVGGGYVVSAGADCQICMTEEESGVVRFRHRMISQVNQLALHGNTLAVALDNGELVVLQV